MEFFFNPQSIALVGASPLRGKWGNNLLRNIARGYKGPIYPINPKYEEIEGLKCYPTAQSVGRRVDLGIVFVPAPLVPAALRDCAAAGVRGVVVQSGGFAETGGEGKALEDQCREIVRETGIRVWGPNCYGLVDGHRNYMFTFGAPESWEKPLAPGSVSLVVQSGLLAGTLMLDVVTKGVTAFAKACSIGNKMDVDELDLLEYLIGDPDTTTIGLYLEAVPNGRRFIDLARSSPKPIVVLKGGSSPQGAKAAISHTASLAGDDRIVRGALAQAGVITAVDVVHLIDLAHALSLVPQGLGQGRVAVLTLSGGAGILSADLLHVEGLRLAELSRESVARLQEWFPKWMPASNPVDMMAAAGTLGAKEVYRRAAEIVCADPGVDTILVQTNVGAPEYEPDLGEIGDFCRQHGKSAFAWVMGEYSRVETTCAEATRHGIPAYHELLRVVQAMRAVFDSGRRRVVQPGERPAEPAADATTIRALESIRGGGTLDEVDSKRVLGAAGIPTVLEEIVGDAEEAARVASRLTFPVVLKGVASDKVHKTELGLVRLGLRSADDVRGAYRELRGKLNGTGRVVVQKQEAVDWEFICGMVRDPFLGPAVVFGLGGVTAELHKDVVFRIAPLTRLDALDMMDSIRSRRVLDGFRGKAPVDREALAQVLVALGRISLDAPWVSEIDVNPLASCGGRLVALDATVIVK